MSAPYSARDFQRDTAVSDETLARLRVYVDLLVKWQAKINLVGRDTLDDVWRRHMLDSAQLAAWIAPGAKIADLGSGAGFPGLVLAIMGTGDVHLVESDQRKCVFLREVNRATAAGATVHAARVENLAPLDVDVVTSRALAPLEILLEYARPHLLSTGKCLYPKGRRWAEELTAAQKGWKMRCSDHPSRTDPAGRILELDHIHKLDERARRDDGLE